MSGILDELTVTGASYGGVIPVWEARAAGCHEGAMMDASHPLRADCYALMAAARRRAAMREVGTVAAVVGAGVLAYFMFGRK